MHLSAFSLYDNHGNGSLPLDQFARVLEGLAITKDPQHTKALIRAADCNGDNRIDFDEFVHAMVQYIPPTPPDLYEQEELTLCFQAFDKNKDGFISEDELAQMMLDLGENMTLQQIREMMMEADTNKDGYIDMDEFRLLLPNTL
ncbi:hypothetical protein BDF14DRAFT_1721466 [Spinellus fusiger]|nr:hypothetical protein BDF14DRAFT_1721466 [Spinellus fusiger]